MLVVSASYSFDPKSFWSHSLASYNESFKNKKSYWNINFKCIYHQLSFLNHLISSIFQLFISVYAQRKLIFYVVAGEWGMGGGVEYDIIMNISNLEAGWVQEFTEWMRGSSPGISVQWV